MPGPGGSSWATAARPPPTAACPRCGPCSPLARLKGVELVAAVDVACPFLDAAERFAPQKGATASQVRLLSRRLERLAQVYLEDHGVDVTAIVGGGAPAGWPAGWPWRRRRGGLGLRSDGRGARPGHGARGRRPGGHR
jgi:hypothetical protein